MLANPLTGFCSVTPAPVLLGSLPVPAGLHVDVHPLTTEPWGVRRFFVRAPDGTVVNVVSHRDE